MAAETLGDVLRRIGRLAGLQAVLSLTDAQLLERFAVGRDEPAFAALMVRHGPMVLGVCRRLLRDADEAEDAFQAAFLVLARKAGAIQRRPLLSAWLYGVTYKVAARLRGRTWKRQTREISNADLTTVAASVEPDAPELPPLLHQEVQRLPDKYRNPIVLCYLEGKTHEEAALLLHWPLGTVKGRLARARDLLRSQLTRRGVTATEGMMATALAAKQVPAPARLTDATIRAATRFAVGETGVGKLASARAIALSQGVLQTMILTKVKIAAALMLAVTMLGGGGAGWLAYRASATAADASIAKADEKSKDDQDAIQGTWQVIGVEIEGEDAPDDVVTKEWKSTKWIIAADKIRIVDSKPGEHKIIYKLDSTKKPKKLDYTPLHGPENERGKTEHLIYSLDGDVLKIYMPFSPTTDKPPTELATKKGDKAWLITFKRMAADKDKPKQDKPEADKQAIQGVWQLTGLETHDDEVKKGSALRIKNEEQWVFTADKITVQAPGQSDFTETYRLYPSKKPKMIDQKSGQGPPEPGIYRLEGDVLKLCFAESEDFHERQKRPTEFVVDDDNKNIILTFRRVSADKEKPIEAKPKDDAKVKKLLKDWQAAAETEFRMRKQVYLAGNSSVEPLAGSARRLLTAELEQSEKQQDRVTACEAYLQQITDVAKMAKIQLQAGTGTPADAAEAEYYRLEAEIMLEREKAK